MRMKILQIINSIPTIQELMNQKMKISTSYKLKKIIDEVNEISKSFDDSRKELLANYAELSQDGEQYTFRDDDAKLAYQNELQVILSDTIVFDFKSISVDEMANIELDMSGYESIEWFMTE